MAADDSNTNGEKVKVATYEYFELLGDILIYYFYDNRLNPILTN